MKFGKAFWPTSRAACELAGKALFKFWKRSVSDMSVGRKDKECRVMKNTLVEMETPGPGRIPLDKSYAGGIDDASSVHFLEQLGALDNADPQHMSVIISNHVNSPSNCVA